MKIIFALILAVGSFAHADCVGIGEPGDNSTCFSCAPEVVEGNAVGTDRILRGLVSSPAFVGAHQFRAVVAHIGLEKNPAVRVRQYLALVGVDASRPADVAAFVGARSAPSAQLAQLMLSTGLDRSQAIVVVESLDQGLRGSLQ